MIDTDKTTDASVTFCELVEHPGGHDGGEFPQETVVSLLEDGTVKFKSGLPSSSNDSFVDCDVRDYVNDFSGPDEALAFLRGHRAKLAHTLVVLDGLVTKLTTGSEVLVVTEDDDGNEVELDELYNEAE